MHKFRWYAELGKKRNRIYVDAREKAREMGLERFNGQMGLCPTGSGNPGPLAKYVVDAIAEARKFPVLPVMAVEDKLRDLVKDVYGDDFDVASTNTCESALRVTFESLFAPPMLRRGDSYRGRFIVPVQYDFEFMGAYGRPFPPTYKSMWVDRSVSAGEFGVEAKCLANLDALIVPLVGAKLEAHGLKYDLVPLLTGVDAEESIERIRTVADRHVSMLVGFETLGYDTPGYGFAEKTEDNVPKLQKLMGDLASSYNLPFVVDCAMGIPIIGTNLSRIGGSVMMWSMDKSCRGLTSGLIIGLEDVMMPIRKGLGLAGERFGTVSSHGKAVYSMCDPGRDAVMGQIEILKVLREMPEIITKPIDDLDKIVREEFSSIEPARLRDGLIITKSYNIGAIEVNYERTWRDGNFGIPIFSTEDTFADSLIMSTIDQMGICSPLIYGGNIEISPWQGTTDEEGHLVEERAAMAVRATVEAIEIVCRHAGLV